MCAQVRELEQLVGCFELDPNRALDLVYGAAEAAAAPGPLLALLPHFSPDARTHALGFRFQAHQGAGTPATPSGLFRVAAAAIQARSSLSQSNTAIGIKALLLAQQGDRGATNAARALSCGRPCRSCAQWCL